jgi:nucleoside-diphosphate-sugar epimerase
MKVFVAGATCVLGRELVPQLVARGHEVVGMTRSGSKQDLVRSLGARPVVADALDPDAVAQAVASAEPEVIVHELTALSGSSSPDRPRRLSPAALASREAPSRCSCRARRASSSRSCSACRSE